MGISLLIGATTREDFFEVMVGEWREGTQGNIYVPSPALQHWTSTLLCNATAQVNEEYFTQSDLCILLHFGSPLIELASAAPLPH